MKTFYEPLVRCIARPQIDWDMVCDFLDTDGDGTWQSTSQSDGELLCEFMGRMCYGSFGDRQGRKDSAEYIRNILKSGHGSVLEHAQYSFLVTRCSRGFTHQAVRHRAGFAFSQESTHFVRYDEGARVCLAGYDRLEETTRAQAETACEDALHRYVEFLIDLDAELSLTGHRHKKLMCGTARALLPIALESKLGFSANLRALRHFCEMRGAADNVVEIRMVACQVAAIMRREAPIVFEDFEEGVADDGFPHLIAKWRKV